MAKEAILNSEITSEKCKNTKSMALNRIRKGYFFTVCKLNQGTLFNLSWECTHRGPQILLLCYIYIYIYIYLYVCICICICICIHGLPWGLKWLRICLQCRRRGFDPLQYFCLENPMNRGVWWATVHEIAKSRTQLSA